MLWWTLRQLKSKNPETRLRAVRRVEELGDARAVGPLMATLKDKRKEVRKAAAEALGRIGDVRAAEPLMAALKDRTKEVRRAVVEALDQIDPNWADSEAASSMFSEQLAALEDSDSRVRKAATVALGRIGNARAVTSLLAALKDEDAEVREAAAEALVAIDPKYRLEVLIETLKSDTGKRFLGRDDPFESAITELGSIGKSATKPLLAAMQDASGYPLTSMIEALGEVGDPDAVESILPHLESDDWFARCKAAEALGKIGDLRALDSLIRALGDDHSSYVRSDAAEALGKLGDSRAIAPLIDALRDDEHYVRREAAEALGELGSERALEPLLDVALNDEDEYVRECAEESLAAIDSTSIARLEAGREERAVAVDPEGKELHALMHGGSEFTKENPITLKGSDARIYRHEGHWVLSIPIDAAAYDRRRITIDPEQDPDKFVFDVLKDAPNWHLGTAPEGKLYKLMKSDWVFDYYNPIVIGGVAYVYYDDGDAEWRLDISVSPEAVKRIGIEEIAPIDEGIDKAVMDAIAAAGLSLT